MPQDVFRDASDNILPLFTVKTIAYLWQGAPCIHLLGAAQARQYKPNTMAICCSCNEALLFRQHLLLQYHLRTIINSKLKQENIIFSLYTNACKGVPICLLVAFKTVVVK